MGARRLARASLPGSSRPLVAVCCMATVSVLVGCAASAGSTGAVGDRRLAASPDRAALIDGTLVTRDDLWPLLAERGGAAGLEALALDRAVAREAQRLGVEVGDEDIRAERAIVERALVDVGLSDRRARGLAVEEARARRGWGPQWFESLLRRNALARKITEDQVLQPTDAQLRRLHESLHGPRREVRVIVMASERAVGRHRADVQGQLDRSLEFGVARFIQLAIDHSSDVSSGRGGLLDPVGRVDATYPDAFRAAVFETEPGQLTPVIALDEGFAFALVIDERPSDGITLEAARPDLLERLELDAEQQAMAALYERLRSRLRVEPMDDSLDWSWSAVRR